MSILKLLEEKGVKLTYKGKNVGQGWVGIRCPFCGDRSDHLGLNIEKDTFNCWICGGHRQDDVVSKLLRIERKEARKLLNKYSKGPRSSVPVEQVLNKPIINKRLLFPSPIYDLDDDMMPGIQTHRNYLLGRGFDWRSLSKEYSLRATGPISMLDKVDYRFRIIIPIFHNNNLVSFQGRDATGRAKRKYMACPMECEIVHHKDILYMTKDMTVEHRHPLGICVEGILDVWRLGPPAFAVFGIEYTKEQVNEMTRIFDEVIVMFDSDERARRQAERLSSELNTANHMKSSVYRLEHGDPADMTQKEANELIKRLTG